ncbi:protein of unknown function [Pseudomonas sp. JV241A]|nr:protein of unknown function [Pseudomonas sp. JV241A]
MQERACPATALCQPHRIAGQARSHWVLDQAFSYACLSDSAFTVGRFRFRPAVRYTVGVGARFRPSLPKEPAHDKDATFNYFPCSLDNFYLRIAGARLLHRTAQHDWRSGSGFADYGTWTAIDRPATAAQPDLCQRLQGRRNLRHW